MASKMDKIRLEHRTALVRKQTAEIELRARWIGLCVAVVGLLTAALTLFGGLLLVALRT